MDYRSTYSTASAKRDPKLGEAKKKTNNFTLAPRHYGDFADSEFMRSNKRVV